MRGPQEVEPEFLERIDNLHREESPDGRRGKAKTKGFNWDVGIQLRSRGTVQSDRWRGRMSSLVGDKLIAIVPVLGWWGKRGELRQTSQRFSLFVTVRGPAVYPPIKPLVGVPIEGAHDTCFQAAAARACYRYDEGALAEKIGTRIVADDVQEMVRLRLGRLKSTTLCKRMLKQRHPEMPEGVLSRKSEGVASAVRSALGFWNRREDPLNARILSRYYAMLQLTIAEEVAVSDAEADLISVQRNTEKGHGLFVVNDVEKPFPEGMLIGCLISGHFASYCRALGVDVVAYQFSHRPKGFVKIAEAERGKLISLGDLLRRLPELTEVVSECIGGCPLAFHVGHASRNMADASALMRHTSPRDPFAFQAGHHANKTVTYGAIYPSDKSVDEVVLNSLDLPFKNIVPDEDGATKTRHFTGEVAHAPGALWWDAFPHYKSGYCGTSIIAPYWGKNHDLVVVNFMILYACSIVVRYLPSLWQRIDGADLDHVRELLEYYMRIVDNVLPLQMLDRISGSRTRVTRSGSFDAPI